MLNKQIIDTLVDPLDLVPLSEAKDHLRVSQDQDLEDDLIKQYIEAAFDSARQYIGAPVLHSDVLVVAPAYAKRIILPVRPVTEITAIKYNDADGTEQTLVAADYQLVNYEHEARINFKKEFETQADDEEAISITLKCGYTAATLPGNIRRAILLEVADMYHYREDRKEIVNKASKAALRHYRIYG